MSLTTFNNTYDKLVETLEELERLGMDPQRIALQAVLTVKNRKNKNQNLEL